MQQDAAACLAETIDQSSSSSPPRDVVGDGFSPAPFWRILEMWLLLGLVAFSRGLVSPVFWAHGLVLCCPKQAECILPSLGLCSHAWSITASHADRCASKCSAQGEKCWSSSRLSVLQGEEFPAAFLAAPGQPLCRAGLRGSVMAGVVARRGSFLSADCHF